MRAGARRWLTACGRPRSKPWRRRPALSASRESIFRTCSCYRLAALEVSYIEPAGRPAPRAAPRLRAVEKELGKHLLANSDSRLVSPRARWLWSHGGAGCPRRAGSAPPSCPHPDVHLVPRFLPVLHRHELQGLRRERNLRRGGAGPAGHGVPLDAVPSFSRKEKAALRYVQCMCRTPLEFTTRAVQDVKESFSPRGFVILASTCAQVNFWTRLIQSLGVPPAGFSADAPILDLPAWSTLKPST